MTILQDDIMTIDQAAADLVVCFVNIDHMKLFVKNADVAKKSITEMLSQVPIMDLNDETIRKICDKHVLGAPQNFQLDTNGRAWFYWRKMTKYGMKFGILIRPRNVKSMECQELFLEKGQRLYSRLWDS